jgi:WD40 repeat protein
LLGRSVSLSATGQRIAIGSTGFDNGLKEDVGACQVYGYLGDWIQFGASLRGQAEDERSGFAVALSSDGERIACGGPGDSVVRVYADNGKGAWEQIGETLSGIPSSNFGAAVALSDDGAFLAIGAPSESYLEPSVGAFRLYNE